MARKTHKKGGQIANRNAGKHLVYMRKYDLRTKEGRAIQQVESELAMALGNDISAQQALLIQRTSVLAVKCHLSEKHILSMNGEAPESLVVLWLRMCRELRSNLLALGLQRQQRPIQDLKSYLKENYE